MGNCTKVTELTVVGLSLHSTSQMFLTWSLMLLYRATFAGDGMILFLVAESPQGHNLMHFFLGNLSLLDQEVL